MARLRTYLVESKSWDKAQEDDLLSECRQQVEQAADQYLAAQPQPPETMFDHLYADLPQSLVEQRALVLAAAQNPEVGDG